MIKMVSKLLLAVTNFLTTPCTVALENRTEKTWSMLKRSKECIAVYLKGKK